MPTAHRRAVAATGVGQVALTDALQSNRSMHGGTCGVTTGTVVEKNVNDTAQLITSVVNAAASKAGRDGVYAPPPDTAPPRRRRRAASLRHLAEVIRTHRMAPGIAVDKDIVAGVLAGDLRYLTDLVPVVAVTRASHHIAGLPFGDDDVQRLAVAVAHLNALLTTAYEYDRRTPYLLPVPRPASALVVERNATGGAPRRPT